jgi:hypothetical protein
MPPTPKAPSIEYRHNVAAARHEIGVKVGKVFVPFATLSDAYYEQLAENSAQFAESEDGEEEEGE